MSMNIGFHGEKDGVILATMTGSIQALAAGQQDEQIEMLLKGCGFSDRVAISLEGCDFIDSSGIGWLLHCFKQFKSSHGKMVLHSIQPLVQNVLTTMRLDSVLNLAENLDDAVQMARDE